MQAVGQTLEFNSHRLNVEFALDKRDILFPSIPSLNRELLLMDSTAMFSVAGLYAPLVSSPLSPSSFCLFPFFHPFWSTHPLNSSDEHSGKRLATLLIAMAAPGLNTPSGPYFGVQSGESEGESLMGSFRQARSDLVVTDASACVGGLTFSLARAFSFVHAVEMDELR